MTISNPVVSHIRWCRDGDVLSVNSVSDDITVNTMTMDEFGNYTCEAVTTLGVVSSNVIAYKKQCK